VLTPKELINLKTRSNMHLPEDRILATTRWVAGLLLPFLLLAWGILYLFPTRTSELFAWPVNPPMTAMFMGAGYLAGAYFFARILGGRRWSHFAAGFPPVAGFATLMLIATLLHWDRFSHGHIAFWAWFLLYLATPFLVLALWWTNRRVAKAASAADPPLPKAVRLMLGFIGTALVILGLLWFAQPQMMIDVWPWTVTPLTARALLSFFILSALTEVNMAFRTHWSEVRFIIQGQLLGLVLILLSAPLIWATLQPITVMLWLFLGAMALLLLTNIAIYLYMEKQRTASTSSTQDFPKN
jgi:hypothetical protein